MDISKLQQKIKTIEETLARMKEQLKEAEQKNDKEFYPENNYCEFRPEYVLKVVDGSHSSLVSAFHWDLTPQGYYYWEQKQHNKSPITDKDKINLLRWCVNYYRSKENQ